MKTEIYKARRAELLNQLDNGIAIIYSNKLQTRSNDTEFTFRQNSNFFYLTGFNEPDAVLILAKNHEQTKSIIFLRDKDPAMEIWTGKRLGVEKAAKTLAVQKAYSITEFEKEAGEYLPGHQNIYVDFNDPNVQLDKVLSLRQSIPRIYFRKKLIPQNICNLGIVMGRMRLIKSDEEVNKLKKAMDITNKAHSAAMAKAKTAKNEYELHALLEYVFKNEGAEYTAYEPIVASGDNANILHYIENNSELVDGELILIDAGSEYCLYASDITRTFPKNGKFSPPQKEVYEWVLKSQIEAIEICKPGVTLTEIHDKAVGILVDGLLAMGILTGDKKKIIEENEFRKFYPHGTGHWLGLDVHDQSPQLDKNLETVKFEPGMVFTVEPGLYFSKDDHSIPEQYRGIGVRIEDNILITSDGYENLSEDIPKTVKETEMACTKDWKEFI